MHATNSTHIARSGRRVVCTLAVLTATLLLTAACGQAGCKKKAPEAKAGIIDLRSWDFERDGIVLLDGRWEFYWKKFLDPSSGKVVDKRFSVVPGIWGSHGSLKHTHDGSGYATYRLRLLLPRGGESLGIKINSILLAADIYIDGTRLSSIGTTGTSKAAMVPQRRVATLFFTPLHDECTITLHVSNFHYSKGGIMESIRLGSAGQILSLREKGVAFDFLLFGSLAILALYHLGLFYYRRTDYTALYFGIFCLLFALRTLHANEIVITMLFPEFSWDRMLQWELVTVYLSMAVASLFYHTLYPVEFNRRVLVLAIAVSSIGILSTIALPMRFVLFLLPLFQICIILTIVYVFFVLLTASTRKRENASWFLAGYILIFTTITNDILLTMDLIRSVQLVHIGFFLFILSQAIVLSRRYAYAFSTIEQRDLELLAINTAISREIADRTKAEEELRKTQDALEEKVRERTRELMESNEKLMQEIVERKKAQETILRTSTIESLGVFAGGIAHDFNNLLMSIMGNISLAKHYIAEDNHGYELLTEAENASTRTRDLTHQLLTFSKGGAPIKKTASISELLKSASEFVIRGSHVKIDFSISNDLRSAEVDTGQISQVIHNLVINALQAMHDGGTIRISAENISIASSDGLPVSDGEYLRIRVSDTGPGIPPEHINRIFDPYFTTKMSGNGLGLAICYSIIKNHNGYIDIESEQGHGATFTIYLPSVSEVREEEKTVTVAQAADRKGTVLIMEDDESVLRTTCKMCANMGIKAIPSRHGEEALSEYLRLKKEGTRVDAVIMDLTIPGKMGGKEAIGMLLKIDPEARVIVSSGYSDDPVMSRYADYGFRDVLIKPYVFEDFRIVMNRVLQ
jgi:signal transduction histidine kinase